MAIKKIHNKACNNTYVYESISYWDKEFIQPCSHRKLIGRIDLETGEIVATGRKTAKTSLDHNDMDYKALYKYALKTIEQKDALIVDIRSQLTTAESNYRSCMQSMKKACDILTDTVSGKERIHG